MESYLRVNLLGPGPRLIKKGIYRAAVLQTLRNTGIGGQVGLRSSPDGCGKSRLPPGFDVRTVQPVVTELSRIQQPVKSVRIPSLSSSNKEWGSPWL